MVDVGASQDDRVSRCARNPEIHRSLQTDLVAHQSQVARGLYRNVEAQLLSKAGIGRARSRCT